MSKGFTVKADAEEVAPPELEWDYAAIKESMRGKTIVFAFQAGEFRIHFSKILCNYVLTWYRMA